MSGEKRLLDICEEAGFSDYRYFSRAFKQQFGMTPEQYKKLRTKPENAVKTLCFLTDINDFAAFNEVYAKYFTEKPARSCVGIQALPKGAICEVEVIAVI